MNDDPSTTAPPLALGVVEVTDGASLDRIGARLLRLRREPASPTPAVRIAGGEPMEREDLPRILARAVDAGFSWIEVVSDGRRLAEPGYARRLVDAGLGVLGLIADGDLDDLGCILDHCREHGVRRVILLPSRDLDEERVRELLAFATLHRDVVRSLHFEPRAVDDADPLRDVIAWVDRGTDGIVRAEHWFALDDLAPVARVAAALDKAAPLEISAHPGCARISAVMVGRRLRPLAEVLDLPLLMAGLDGVARDYARRRRLRGAIRGLRQWLRVIAHPEIASLAASALNHRGDRDFVEQRVVSRFVVLSVAACQGMDVRDTERLRTCPLQVALPDGSLTPRCARHADPAADRRPLHTPRRRL